MRLFFTIAGGVATVIAAAYLNLAASKTALATASLKHMPTGLFIQGEYARQDIATFDAKLDAWTLQGGIESAIVPWGVTTALAEFGSLDVNALRDRVRPGHHLRRT